MYNDVHTTSLKNEILTSVIIPYEPTTWINFGMQANNEKISFYHNCLKISEKNVTREPMELNFDSASTFYLAQAGSVIKENFEVILNDLLNF